MPLASWLVGFEEKVECAKGGHRALRRGTSRPADEIKNWDVPYLFERGYAKRERILSVAKCRESIAGFEAILREHPEIVWLDEEYSDYRLFAAEKWSRFQIIWQIFSTASRSLSANLATNLIPLTMMFGKTVYKQDNLGSGQGWHTDPIAYPYKLMIYLNSVTSLNGPLSVISATSGPANQPGYSVRFTEQEVSTLPQTSGYRLSEIAAPAGTLVTLDGSCIHRGTPLKCGERYAVTCYLTTPSKFEDANDRLKNACAPPFDCSAARGSAAK